MGVGCHCQLLTTLSKLTARTGAARYSGTQGSDGEYCVKPSMAGEGSWEGERGRSVNCF